MSLVRRAAKRSKYGAIKQTVDGVQFDSKREAKRYCELKLLERAAAINGLELQPEFPLEVIAPNGEVIQVAIYRADFRYRERGGLVVEDSKGFRTPAYRLKKRMVEAQYAIEIREV
jgi:hypothetical protein